MVATGFSNSWTGGEICQDAWDRVDLQPVEKGCEEATNWIIRIAGPLAKRRGFWHVAATRDQSKHARLVPFRKSVDDALMLQFEDVRMRVFTSSGDPLLTTSGVQVEATSPWAHTQLAGLRYKQVGDVIYFRHRDGLQPYTLVRQSNTVWSFAPQAFDNGPWLPENSAANNGIEIQGAAEHDVNGTTNASCILAGTDVVLNAQQAIFQPGHVGALFRLRRSAGAPSAMSWTAGLDMHLGYYAVSNSRIYRCASHGTSLDKTYATNPPVGEGLAISDGVNSWDFRHDGAGVVLVTGYTDAQHVKGHVLRGCPLSGGELTQYWSEQAYSPVRGWPRMWPSMREERLVDGATAGNLDFVDLTGVASFDARSADYTPGTGTNLVLDTDAIRRRVGEDGSEILWAHIATYLVCGTTSGEYLIAGSVLDEPLNPSALVKRLSGFGSADVYPAQAHKGLIFVARGGKTLRELEIDTQQGASGQDLGVLATDIVGRGVVQLAWVAQPDETLWMRLADGSIAAMTYHQEQQVRGFTRQALAPGWTVEDMAVLPGPGKLDTLWIIASRTKNGAPQRLIWMLSAQTDAMFLDGAAYYSGPPATTIGNLSRFEGETVSVVADGAWVAPDPVVKSGQITLKTAARVVRVGQPYTARFKTLRLDVEGAGRSLNMRQRPTGATVSLLTAEATVYRDGAADRQTVSSRGLDDIAAASAQRLQTSLSLGGDTDRDPRIVIEDATPYDARIYSIQPHVET